MAGNILDRGEQPAFLGEFVDDPAFGGIDSADGGRGVLRQRFMAGQIARIKPQHATHHQRHGHCAQRHKAEDGPEERADEPDHARNPRLP